LFDFFGVDRGSLNRVLPDGTTGAFVGDEEWMDVGKFPVD